MSKFVKDLITNDLRNRLDGVEDALLVDVIGLENNKNVALRQQLRKKNIHLLVVKNSLARRATEGTPLAPAFEGARRHAGADLGRRGHRLAGQGSHQNCRGQGVRQVPAQGRRHGRPAAGRRPGEGRQQVAEPPGAAQHSGRPDPSPGATLSSQLLGAGAKLASQIKKKSEGEEEAEPASA